jgi:hypothetical protein
VQEVQLHKALTKKGAPTIKRPHAKADSDKGSPRQKGFNVLGVSPLEWGTLEYDPIE